MKKVQSLLGDHQDSVIARQVERELGITAYLDGENAFTYGLLYGMRRQYRPAPAGAGAEDLAAGVQVPVPALAALTGRRRLR
jgi:hypothetical protein